MKSQVYMSNADSKISEVKKYNLFTGQSLKKKWKNIRSCFAREIRRMKNTKSGSSASHKTPYIYFKQLLFLKNTIGNLNPERSITEEEKSTTDQEPLGPYSRENIVGRKKKKPSDDGTRELLETLNKCIDTRKNNADILERDEDRMFLLSLLSSFRKIPEHKKPAAKIQLITMIDSFGTNTPNNVYPNSVWRNYNEFEFERGYFTPEAGSSTARSQTARLRSEAPTQQNYYTLPTSVPAPQERSESQVSTATSSASQDSDYLDLF